MDKEANQSTESWNSTLTYIGEIPRGEYVFQGVMAEEDGAAVTRYHKKKDGILRLGADGSVRFLTRWERLLFKMGWRI